MSQASELDATLQQALQTVRDGRSAVVEVMTLPISAQVLGTAEQGDGIQETP